MEEYYAILYLEHRINSRSIYAEFFDSNTVEVLLASVKNINLLEFWQKVNILTANIRNDIFLEIFPNVTTPNGGNPVFKVTLQTPSQNQNNTIRCYEYMANNYGDITSRRTSIVSASAISGNIRDILLNQFDNAPLTKDFSAGSIQDIQDLAQTRMLFTVHSIGQGLATSLSMNDKIPFLYFDYGMTADKNSTNIKALPVDCNNTVIILSHVHEDHWCAYRNNNMALNCTWYVPDQIGSGIYYQFLGKIAKSGGKAILYKAGFAINNITICHSTTSSIKPRRSASGTHETGYGMYINATTSDNEKPLKILVAGDQDYDYQNSQYLKDIDILVACHHGGSYCWSKKFVGITPASDSSTVIYSYGKGNKYKHPSKTADYQNWGWLQEHHTAKDGDFTVTIN